MARDLAFEELVNTHYAGLYRFALSLAGSEAEAGDLTQQTFYRWATKGHQLLDPSKVKAWLYTTLHREFLGKQRRIVRFPHQELDEMGPESPQVPPPVFSRLDTATVLAALGGLEETFRAPIALFYLEDYPYKEIAEILQVPVGTVKSRISRGLSQLQARLAEGRGGAAAARKESHG